MARAVRTLRREERDDEASVHEQIHGFDVKAEQVEDWVRGDGQAMHEDQRQHQEEPRRCDDEHARHELACVNVGVGAQRDGVEHSRHDRWEPPRVINQQIPDHSIEGIDAQQESELERVGEKAEHIPRE